jgi:hypothetical protein
MLLHMCLLPKCVVQFACRHRQLLCFNIHQSGCHRGFVVLPFSCPLFLPLSNSLCHSRCSCHTHEYTGAPCAHMRPRTFTDTDPPTHSHTHTHTHTHTRARARSRSGAGARAGAHAHAHAHAHAVVLSLTFESNHQSNFEHGR